MKNNGQNPGKTNASNRYDQGSEKDSDYFAKKLIETSEEEANDQILQTEPARLY